MKFKILFTIILFIFASLGSADELRNAVNSKDRSEKNIVRDEFRKPYETLSFFQLEPNMTIVELSPGGGWYTEILANFVRKSGSLIAAHFSKDSDHLNDFNLDICIPVHGENQLNYFKEINKINSRAFKLETDNFHKIKEEFDKCSFFIGVDTGLTHICAGLGLSGIFLFGPTDPSKVGPVFDHQKVIKKSEMTEINPSLIIEMLKEESFE